MRTLHRKPGCQTTAFRETSETSYPYVSAAAHDTLPDLMRTPLSALVSFLRATILPKVSLALENAALRQELPIFQRSQGRVSLRRWDQVFWVLLRRL